MGSYHADGQDAFAGLARSRHGQLGVRIPHVMNDALRNGTGEQLVGKDRYRAVVDGGDHIAIGLGPWGNACCEDPIHHWGLWVRVARMTDDVISTHELRGREKLLE